MTQRGVCETTVKFKMSVNGEIMNGKKKKKEEPQGLTFTQYIKYHTVI